MMRRQLSMYIWFNIDGGKRQFGKGNLCAHSITPIGILLAEATHIRPFYNRT
ncbi:hypothetical protein MKQ70_26660 [Chitinophaga sedimenti]|uniref:hypothetical protein n=1 Tax=Chitinophaga sedimenti TaxID=2033606 RepID=UPI002002FF14|nr:hypothetical protein [Chitinophaga sedimenti]MCK7558390.1 hypothetical protein [Chitinophaga sedimenti]